MKLILGLATAFDLLALYPGCVGRSKSPESKLGVGWDGIDQFDTALREAKESIPVGMNVVEAKAILVAAGCSCEESELKSEDDEKKLHCPASRQQGLWVKWVWAVDVHHDGQSVEKVTMRCDRSVKCAVPLFLIRPLRQIATLLLNKS